MNLLKTSILNGVAVLIKTLTMFILNKVLAVYVGPSGYAAIGQFQNFIQIITSFSGGAINTAVVKYTAEYYRNDNKQIRVWVTACKITLIFSIVVAVLILCFHKYLSIYIFQSTEYQSIFIWFGVFLIFFNFNALFLAILNGKKEILKLVSANIAGSILSLLVTAILSVKYRLYGALVALSINQSIVFIVTLTLCFKSDWFNLKSTVGKIDINIAKKFARYALMALTSAICIPASQILIRLYLSEKFGFEYAGYWEGMVRLSSAYLMMVTTTLSVYYLPKLSELEYIDSIKAEVYSGYKFILPVAVLGAVILYTLRDWIISILFTGDFFPMRELFLWHLIGDVLKIGSWILAFLMLGKAMTTLYIMSELLFATGLVLLTIICCNLYGFSGVSFAYAVNYALYWALMGLTVFRILRRKDENTITG